MSPQPKSTSKPADARMPEITPLTLPELKLAIGAGPGGKSGGPGRENCVCVCA